MVWIIAPLISLSMLFTPHHLEIMTFMPAKNSNHEKGVKPFLFNCLIRFCIIPAVSCVAVFWCLLWYNVQTPDLILLSQNLAMIVFILDMIIISSTCIRRYESVLKQPPFINKAWLLMVIICIILQAIFTTISLLNKLIQVEEVPWFIYLIALFPMFFLVPLQELMKAKERKEWIRFQKRSKLEFNTKLGMHSPL